MKSILITFIVIIVVVAIIALAIILTNYSAYKEFLNLEVGDILQQYETISYEEWMSGSEDITQNIGKPRKIVNVSGDKKNYIIILEDGTQLNWEKYKDYEFEIIKKVS